jgi:hypothetical protein
VEGGRRAARLAGACWAEASGLADQRHAAAEAGWAQEKKDLGLEIAELVTDLDKVGAEKDAAVTELTARIAVLEAQVAAAGEQLAQARAKTLQEARDALLDGVAPAAPGTDPGARPAPGGKD